MHDTNHMILESYNFSVLLPVYHGDKLQRFKQAVDSIVDNTLSPNQVVIVRDGPVLQDMEEYLKQLQQNDLFTIVFLQENVGLAKALNIAFGYVENEFIFRADADDINSVDRFERCLPLLVAGYDLVGAFIAEVDHENNILGYRNTPNTPEEILKYIKFRNPFNHMTIGYKLSSVLSVGGYPDLYLKEDYGLWISLLGAGYSGINIDYIAVEALAGDGLLQRRSGIKYLKSELDLRKLLVANNLQTEQASWVICLLRIISLSMPQHIKKYLYKIFLRKNK